MLGKNKVGDFHLIYDGEPLSDHFIVKSVEMPLLPNIDVSTLSIDGKPGLWFAARKIETRTITVHIAMLNDNKNRVDMMDKWILQSDYLAKDKPKKLELGGGYYVNAIMVGDSLIKRENGVWSEADITFVCYDPYIYGEEHIENINAGTNKVVIHGKQPVWPVFEITGHSQTAPNAVTVTDTGETVRVPNLSDLTRLMIDNETHKCTVNGVYKPVDPSVTDFFSLNTGEHTIRLDYGSGTMKYREMYL